MKANLGKQTGIALALLATLLATLFAMGVFSVAQASSHNAERGFSADTVAPGHNLVVTITLNDYTGLGSVTETLPTGFTYVSSNAGIIFEQPNNQVRFAFTGLDSFTYTVTAPEVEDTYDFSGSFTFGSPGTTVVVGGASEVTVAMPTTNGGNGAESEDPVSSQEPGAKVRIELSLDAEEAIPAGDDFTVNLKGFSLPDSIANTAVLISSGGYTGSPAEVLVGSSGVVTISLYSRWPGGAQADPIRGAYDVTFKQSAGINNPAAAGDITITVKDKDETDHELTHKVERVIKLSKTKGTRGTMTTATLKGFANDTATLNLNGSKLAEVNIADNIGEYEIDTTDSDFKANQDNTLTAVDSGGGAQDVSAKFVISPKVTLDPDETEVSKDVTVKLSDWVKDDTIATVAISGVSVTPTSTRVGDDGKAEFKITVPSNANRGSQTVKVTGTANAFGSDPAKTVSATASLKIGVLALDIQPSKVVPGQEITITGSGFKADDEISKVTVGGKVVDLDDDEATASSAGNIVITIKVPSRTDESADSNEDGIGDGDKTVRVEADTEDRAANSGRVAEGSINIPKAEISLSPGTSRRGTEVTVTGSGFPAGDLVQIKYVGTVVAARATDSSGHFTAEFDVPNSANIGKKHEVEAKSVGNFKADSAKADHSTPGATITLSSGNVASGQTITIAGMNFPAFASVAEMMVGGVDVRPVPAPATSIDGDFESTVLVPGLDLGNQNVKVTVKPVTITTFLEIVATAAPSDPADVFASLIDNGSLSRIWYLERETQEWSFFDPAPEFAPFNTLNEVSTGQILDIIMNAQDEFQGETLYVGSNPIAIE